jgi:hypothetical protein
MLTAVVCPGSRKLVARNTFLVYEGKMLRTFKVEFELATSPGTR